MQSLLGHSGVPPQVSAGRFSDGVRNPGLGTDFGRRASRIADIARGCRVPRQSVPVASRHQTLCGTDRRSWIVAIVDEDP